MTADDRDRAFDRFWSKSNGRSGGSGLGLPIVRQLVEVCGGTVSLRDVRPHGLDAVVALQASPVRVSETGATRTSRATRSQAPATRSGV
jgi:signal transduction histidine kinase